MSTLMRAPRKWVRLSGRQKVQCPVCGHDHGCMIADDGTAAWCLRVRDGCATRRDGTAIEAKGGMGWLHWLEGNARDGARASSLHAAPPPERLSRAAIEQMLKRFRADLVPRKLEKLAGLLGVTVGSLMAYGVGYDTQTGCHTFPMVDGDLKAVGVRLRSTDGKYKGCVRGGRNGLFVPLGFADGAAPIPEELGCRDAHPLLLLMPEGPTDCAAATDLGFRAVGRPSNTGGAEQARHLLSRHPRQEVVVVADHDGTKWRKGPDGKPTEPFWPGWEGALALAETILPACGSLKVIKPPEKAKDLREWVRNRGQAGMLLAVLAEAQPVTREWLRLKRQEVEVWRRRLRPPQ